MKTAEEIVEIIRRRLAEDRVKADECLRAGNNLGFDVYIERTIALDDLLVEIQR